MRKPSVLFFQFSIIELVSLLVVATSFTSIIYMTVQSSNCAVHTSVHINLFARFQQYTQSVMAPWFPRRGGARSPDRGTRLFIYSILLFPTNLNFSPTEASVPQRGPWRPAPIQHHHRTQFVERVVRAISAVWVSPLQCRYEFQ